MLLWDSVGGMIVVGNSQKSLQPFFAYGYCVLEGDACVDSSSVPNGKPNHASVPFSELCVGPCGERPEVTGEQPEHALAFSFELYAGVTCPPVLAPPKATADEVRS